MALLLPHGDPLAVDSVGRTALMLAAERGHAEVVDLLLPVSDASAVDKVGDDAAARAEKCGHGAMADRIGAFARAQMEQAEIRAASGGARAGPSRPKPL